MAKRAAEEVDDGSQAYLKRQKISNPTRTVTSSEDIRSARQLRQLLTFEQDAGRSRHGIQSFKTFLDAFSDSESDNSGRTALLQEYLVEQQPADVEEKTFVYLTDIMQTWSFASQSNDDSLLSAVPAVLALLLKTLSNILELSDYGLTLGRTLLQKRQQELIARGVTANKGKEFVISPSLRLLKELASYDGGTLAKQLFRTRDQTFKSLARNLSLKYKGDNVEDRKKPSVRTNSLRFVLAVLKYLPVESKREFLNLKDVMTGLVRDIRDDPPFMVRDILETLKVHVLQDDKLPRDARKAINATSLSRIASLYSYDQMEDETSKNKKSINDLAHEFLVLACTSPDLGILNRQSGFYPRGVDPDETHGPDEDKAFIDLGLDSIEWMGKFTEKVPVRNTILSEFIKTLRPWSDTNQSSLLLAILRSAPELVADYFYANKAFTFEPKLTTTWIGYSAFIHSTLQLAVPRYFGHAEGYARIPPPSSIVLESVLPQPLTQKVLNKCLKVQPHKLITFFVVRLLTLAFSKMKHVLEMFREAAAGASPLWAQAGERLTTEFCLRIPSIKDVIAVFRKMADSDLMQREAITRLLVLYYEVVPQVALDAKFDVSETLAQTLRAVEQLTLSPEDRAFRVLELENLFQFAHFSPGMKWFTKVDGLTISPFMAMLKLSAEASEDIPLLGLRSVLVSVVAENQIFQNRTSVSALDSLVMRLKASSRAEEAAPIYEFLDDCISRCASKPIKYIFALEEIQTAYHEPNEEAKPVSLLTLAILEQWPFLAKSADETALEKLSLFTSQYLAASLEIKEDKKAIKVIIKKLAAATPSESMSQKALEKTEALVDDIEIPDPVARVATKSGFKAEHEGLSEQEKADVGTSLLGLPSDPTQDHSALTKWTNKEVEEVIEGGHAASLIMLLSSEFLSVRKEAVTNIAKLAAKLKDSTYEEKEQIWLLLCEVVETAKKTIDAEPLTTIISSFASASVAVLYDPLHCLYEKINLFLSQGPSWELEKVPLLYKVLDEAPTLDDAHYTEISWLLNYLLVGLRTAADMAIFHKRRVFEKLFSLYNNAYLTPGLREKILKILFRATTIEDGSTTLITRFSGMTWLEAQVALGGGVPLKLLMERVMDSCNKKRVEMWQGAHPKGKR